MCQYLQVTVNPQHTARSPLVYGLLKTTSLFLPNTPSCHSCIKAQEQFTAAQTQTYSSIQVFIKSSSDDNILQLGNMYQDKNNQKRQREQCVGCVTRAHSQGQKDSCQFQIIGSHHFAHGGLVGSGNLKITTF